METYLAKVVDNIREIGAFSEHGSDLEEFITGFEGTPWWDDSQDLDPILDSEEFWQGFRDWMKLRYAYAVRQLKEDIKYKGGWPLKIQRALFVKEDWRPEEEGVGVYWTMYSNQATPYQGDPKAGKEVLLETHVSVLDIDWGETIRSRMDYMHGDREGEIRVKNGVTLKVSLIQGDLSFADGPYQSTQLESNAPNPVYS